MSPLGWLHTLSALAALAAGAAVLLRRKGTRSHRRLGWLYVASMVATNVTALFIHRLFTGFGPFHAGAVVSLAFLAGGVSATVRRRPAGSWIVQHYYWMTWSYVGLVAAAASEAATRLPGTVFWGMVVLASAAVFVAGGVLIEKRARATLAPFHRPAKSAREPAA